MNQILRYVQVTCFVSAMALLVFVAPIPAEQLPLNVRFIFRSTTLILGVALATALVKAHVCKCCGRLAPLIDGKCPDCRH